MCALTGVSWGSWTEGWSVCLRSGSLSWGLSGCRLRPGSSALLAAACIGLQSQLCVSVSQIHFQWPHVVGVKPVIVGVYTPWQLANTTNQSSHSTSRESMFQHLTGYHYLGSQLGMRARVSESLLWAFPCAFGFFTAW